MDPIHKNDNDKWYFWDEAWADEIGPYKSEEEARKKLKEYCDWLYGDHE